MGFFQGFADFLHSYLHETKLNIKPENIDTICKPDFGIWKWIFFDLNIG
jgi:hypothetical protein